MKIKPSNVGWVPAHGRPSRSHVGTSPPIARKRRATVATGAKSASASASATQEAHRTPAFPGTLRTSTSSAKNLVSTFRHDDGDGHVGITIAASMPGADEVRVLWGVYRASPNAWQFPKAIETEGAVTAMDDEMGAMSTSMSPLDSETAGGTHVGKFRIPSKAPLTFAYALHVRRGDDWHVETPARGGHFTVQIGVDRGFAGRLGPSLMADGTINFAVECRGGEYVSLVLVREEREADAGDVKVEEFALDPVVNRSGAVWHAATKDTGDILGYGWRVNGDLGWEQGARVAPDSIMLDPEASRIEFVEPCDKLSAFPRVQTRTGEDVVALSGVPAESATCTGSSRATRPSPGVGGFGMLSVDPATFGHDVDGVKHPGTFLGIAEAAQHFLMLGIKTLVVRHPYALTANRAMSFFAPDPSLAASGDTEDEFKLMVDNLHTVGIRVLIAIDLTLTAEGSDAEPNPISWRGLDNANYYRANGVFNCGNPVAQEHVVRALRHWALAFGVDGFEFVYAETMTQNMDEVVMDAPALPDALAHDPVLSSKALIAAPFDETLLPRSGERGFPHWGRWMESNGQKATAMRYFLSPDADLMMAVAASIAGRPHLFSPSFHGFPGCLSTKRPVGHSINALDAWDAAAVASTAASVRAMMLADGIDDGVPTASTVSRAILASILFSSGTPSIPSEALTGDTIDFVRDCLTCRPILGNVLDSGSVGTWHGPSGHTISLDAVRAREQQGEGGPADHFLGRLVSCHAGSLYVAVNPDARPISVTLPGESPTAGWKLVVDSYTGQVSTGGVDVRDGVVLMGKSVSVFVVG